MKRIKKIICPVDFSDLSDETLEIAIQLATQYNSEFHLIYVIPRPNLYDWSLTGMSAVVLENWFEETKKEVDKKISNLVDLIKKDNPKLTVSAEVSEYMDPAEGIIEAAKDQKADLIIMGSHGRKGFNRILMGSVAEGVLRHATCRVIIYKGTGDKSS